MKFIIEDFVIKTDKKIEELSEGILIATAIRNEKPSNFRWKNKTRELTVFSSLLLINKKDSKFYKVISNLFEMIDLIEILKAFVSNKLETSKEYKIGDSFTAATAQKDGKVSLEIHFKNWSYSLFFDKFECSSLAAKFSKILQKCEAWQE